MQLHKIEITTIFKVQQLNKSYITPIILILKL